jgi:hypothetical protein
VFCVFRLLRNFALVMTHWLVNPKWLAKKRRLCDKAIVKAGLSLLWLQLFLCAWRTGAQPVVYEATGAREQVQAVVDQFEHDIVYGAAGDAQHPPANLGSYRVATLDDVPAASGVGQVSSGGLLLVGEPGAGLFVGDNGAGSFSSPNSLRLDTTSTGGSDFFYALIPNSSARYHQNAFGAVFANTPPGSAALEGAFQDGAFFRYEAEPAIAPGEFSFIGVIDPQQFFSITTLRMNATFSPDGSIPPSNDAGIADQLILGVAVPLPEPGVFWLLVMAAVVGGTMRLVGRARMFREIND